MIDAHHHFWQIGRHDCIWPTPDLTALYRDFGPKEFLPLAKSAGITGSVLVQSQESDADTDYLLAVASQCDFIKAVVGWVDLAAASAPDRIAQLASQPKMRGVRPMLQSAPEDDWILRASLEPAVAAMKQQGLVLDALVYTRHLPHVELFAKRHPDLSIVINHAAKPPLIAGMQACAEWRAAMASIANLPNVYCKLSGLPAEAGKEQTLADLAPYVAYLLKTFGPRRLMWGSDWPVIGLAPNKQLSIYKNWLHLVHHALSDCDLRDIESVFIGTSLRFYRIT